MINQNQNLLFQHNKPSENEHPQQKREEHGNCSPDQQAAAVTTSPSPPHTSSPHFPTDQAVTLLTGIQCELTNLSLLRKGSHIQFMLFPSKEFNVNLRRPSHINLCFALARTQAYPTFETYFWRSMRRHMCRGFAASCSSHATALVQAGSAGTTSHCPSFKKLKTNSGATRRAPQLQRERWRPELEVTPTESQYVKGSEHHIPWRDCFPTTMLSPSSWSTITGPNQLSSVITDPDQNSFFFHFSNFNHYSASDSW